MSNNDEPDGAPRIVKLDATVTFDSGDIALFTIMYTDTTGIFWRCDREDREVPGMLEFLDAMERLVGQQRAGTLEDNDN